MWKFTTVSIMQTKNVGEVSKLWGWLVQICVETESKELKGKDNQDIDGENRNRRAKYSYMSFIVVLLIKRVSAKFSQL